MDAFKKSIIALITTLGIVGAAFFGYKGVVAQSEVDILNGLYQQKQRLEDQVQECNLDRVQFMVQLSKKYSSSVVIKDLLRPLDYPVWIKKVSYDDNGLEEYRMWYINPAYERALDITNDRYYGKTDFEVGRWSEETASEFYRNDSIAFAYKDHICEDETFPLVEGDPTTITTGKICKWPFKLDGSWAIAGMFVY